MRHLSGTGLQDGRQVILSSSQTLKEWQAISSIRASVEKTVIAARGASQPPGEPIEFGHPGREATTVMMIMMRALCKRPFI